MSKVSPVQIGPGKSKKIHGTDDIFTRRLEVNGESAVILEHGDILWSISVGRFNKPMS
jgi:hypothetical protein